MSITVPLDELAGRIAQRGAGYLLTAADGGRPHVLHLNFGVDGVVLRAEVGRSAVANITAQPEVSLLWPASDDQTYSLIVDATATIEHDSAAGDDAPATAVITATGAILHRPAPEV